MYSHFLSEIRKFLTEKKAEALWLSRQSVSPFDHAFFFEKGTGFTGSTGQLCITQDQAVFFLDGRYLLQAQKEIDSFLYHCFSVHSHRPQSWLEDQKKIKKVLIDPFAHTLDFKNEKSCLEFQTLTLQEMESISPAKTVNHRVVSEISELKLPSFQEKARKLWPDGIEGKEAYLLSHPHQIAWLLNLRGCDQPYTPVFYGFCIVVCRNQKFEAHIYPFFEQEIHCQNPFLHFHAFSDFSTAKWETLICHYPSTPLLAQSLRSQTHFKDDHLDFAYIQSIKSDIEVHHMRKCHHADALALIRFFHWLEAAEEETEFSVAQQLERFRQRDPGYKGPSFPTISAFQEHSAIVHYHPSLQENKVLGKGIYLCDSGGQYHLGTTDVTRTLILGRAALPEEKKIFTAVLQGHIQLASLNLPVQIRGGHLDVIARHFLWQIGKDYAHSTGHGVGSQLCVHEAFPSISLYEWRRPLAPHMVFSNEPGCYLPEKFGVRIESLVCVQKHDYAGTMDLPFFLETLTLVPIDKRLIEVTMLSLAQKEWLNAYHQQIYNTLSEQIEPEVKEWLYQVTQPL
jgi:Xaa-Pro aminopeptidase